MKRGLVLALALSVLATGLLAVHCGGVRDELAQLELRTVLGLSQDEVRYLYNNERLEVYDQLVAAAHEQLDELVDGLPVAGTDLDRILPRLDEQRAEDGLEPVVFVQLAEADGRRSLVPIGSKDLLDPVAFMDTVPADTRAEFVYPEGQWSTDPLDALLGNGELAVLQWLEPWMAALDADLARIEVIRAEGQAAFAALDPARGQLRINPVLLHLAAARSYAVSTAAAAAPAVAVSGSEADQQAGAARPAVKDEVQNEPDSRTPAASAVSAAGAAAASAQAVAGQLAQAEQALVEADVSGCTCSCFESGDGECTHLCYHDPDAEGDECVYGCADDPETCATVNPAFVTDTRTRRTSSRLVDLSVLAVPAFVFLGWVRRIRRRGDDE